MPNKKVFAFLLYFFYKKKIQEELKELNENQNWRRLDFF